MSDQPATFAPYLEAIEAGLRQVLTCPHPALVPYYDMMRYHLGWVDEAGEPVQRPAGKRLRPLLCLLTCQAAGGREAWQRAIPAAVAVELLHNFSLIHDDIEDGDAERRHRLTVWKVWGVPHAINAGDGMFVLAHQALQWLADDCRVSAGVLVALNHCLDAACLDLCHGQFLDMSFETRLEVTAGEYLYMIQGKTASLFAAALEMGALLGEAEPPRVAHYHAFGWNLGLAFQVQDDVLGIWGDPAVTGKPAASDLWRRKKSWPVVYALEHASGPTRETLETFYRQAQPAGADVARVLDILNDLGARSQAEAVVAGYHEQALRALDQAAGHEPAQGWLRELAQTLVGRET